MHTSVLDGVSNGRIGTNEAAKILEEESQEFKADTAAVDQVAIDTVYYIDRSKI